jgi:hypothetical protein
MITSVALLAKASMEPELSLPAGTIAAFARAGSAFRLFRVEAFGRVEPTGQSVRYPSPPPTGVTVTLSEYATALEGMLHRVLACIGKLRVVAATKLGAPKGEGKP